MMIFRTKPFTRLARREGLTDDHICMAVQEMNSGLIDANLGSGLFKKRIAVPGKGKSGGWRTLIGFKTSEKAFFLYVFPKKSQDNIQRHELIALKKLAKFYLSMKTWEIEAALERGELHKMDCDEKRQ